MSFTPFTNLFLRVGIVALCSGLWACDPPQEEAPKAKGPEKVQSSKVEPKVEDMPDPKKPESGASGLKIGADCKDNAACASGYCVQVLRRGPDHPPELVHVCSECAASSDCPTEKPHCVYDLAMGANVCGDGSLGQLCQGPNECNESSECALVNLGDNKIPLTTCSSCTAHTDCTDPEKPLCITLPPKKRLKPHNECAAEGVRKDGEMCFPCQTGDRECEGLCVQVKIPGKDFCAGVCGECRTDADCDAGEICSKPELNMGSDGTSNNVPSKCVAKG